MSSEPEYFYTIELPEPHGRILEKLASFALLDPEEYAARLLAGLLERADRMHEADIDAILKDAEEEFAQAIASGSSDHQKSVSRDLDDDVPF